MGKEWGARIHNLTQHSLLVPPIFIIARPANGVKIARRAVAVLLSQAILPRKREVVSLGS
jgi:hypothetical protein